MPKESKLIRLDLEVYGELDKFRLRRESFSNAVWRLLKVYTRVSEMTRNLGGKLPEESQRR